MIQGKISVVIPARNERFLQKTIDDILTKAREDVEVIAVLDGYDPELKFDPRLKIIRNEKSIGMRQCINAGVAISEGEYILKSDAHIMYDEGFDVKLKADCLDNWVVVPRRYKLEPEEWTFRDPGHMPVDYEYISFPNDPNDFGGPGLHGRRWRERTRERYDDPQYQIDDLMTFQGSCWFMKRSYFDFLELMDHENYGSFAHEAQEICLKAWLSGGRVVTNKKTWYAHLHKGKKYGRGYSLSENTRKKGTEYTNRWMKNEAWHKQKLPFSWLIQKFSPVPGWAENWEELV